MLSGKAGEVIVAAARAVLQENGLADLVLERASFPAHLPLIGLARATPADATHMLALDFGQSSIKRGIAAYQDGVLVELRLLPPSPPVCGPTTQPPSLDAVGSRWRHMLAIVAASWSQVPHGVAASPALGISLACYLLDGHPAPRDQGCYGSLQLLAPHLETFMREQIASHLGMSPSLILLHDGTAAAAAYARVTKAVVLTLGTAIGHGFPPGASLRSLHSRFVIG